MPVGPDAETLWRIDHEIHLLAVQRDDVLRRLRALSAPRHVPGRSIAPTGSAATGAVAPAPQLPPPPPAPWPGGPARVADRRSVAGGGVSLANLLLGLGSALVVLAAVVFVAVSWEDLTAVTQGLVLAGLTAAGMAGTRSLVRRGLTATAEAIAVVTVALLPVDAEAVREAARALGVELGPDATLIGWCVALGLIAVVSRWFGRFSGTRAPLVAAALAAQVPVPLFVIGWPVDGTVGLVVILAQAAVTLAAVRRTPATDRAARSVALAGAGLLWSTATVAACALGVDGDAADRGTAALVVALAAAVAAMVATLWADDDSVRPLAAGTATGVALYSAGLATSIVAAGAAWWAAMAAVAVTAAAVAVRAPRRWGGPPAGVAGVVAAVLSLPLLVATGTTVVAALDAVDPAWHHDAWTSTREVAGGALDIDGLGGGPVLAHLVISAGAALALSPRLGRRGAAAGLAAAVMTGLVLLPLLVDVPLVATVSVLVAGAGAASLALVRSTTTPAAATATARAAGTAPQAAPSMTTAQVTTGSATAPTAPTGPVAAVGSVCLATVGLAWAAAAPATTVGAVAAIGVLAAAVAIVAVRGGAATTNPIAAVRGAATPIDPTTGHDATPIDPTTGHDATPIDPTTGHDATPIDLAGGLDGNAALAHAASAVAVLASVAEAGLVAAALGAPAGGSWTAAALVAAGASGICAVLDPAGTRRDLPGEVGRSTEVVAAVLHVVAAVAVAGTGDGTLTTVVFAVGAATAAVHALRPGRRAAAVGAAVEALVLAWLRLAWAHVAVPEAYTLPVAGVLLAAAVAAWRAGVTRDLPSWTVHGPWLVAAVAPTALIALDDPGFVRPLGGLVAGVAVLVAGAVTRTRAAVDVGAVTVAALGLHQLSPVVAALPNWSTLGTCGLVLLAVGATFEQRRRDLGILRTHYAELR